MIVKSIVVFVTLLFHFNGMCQDWHIPLEKGESFGIPFFITDTCTNEIAFNSNNTNRFFSNAEQDSLLENYNHRRSDGLNYEVQRIVEGDNIFTNVRFKGDQMWFRYSFWIHFIDGNRPSFRQRVYIEPNLNDLSDANDLLVFQANYAAFGIFDYYSIVPEGKLEGIAILKYIEKLLVMNCHRNAKPWYVCPVPEFGNVSSVNYEIMGSDLEPIYSDHDKVDDNFELYLGFKLHPIASAEGTLYIQFFPVGNFKALHVTGKPWINFNQFYRSKKSFTYQIKTSMQPLYKRDCTIGIHGVFQEYTSDGHLFDECYFLYGSRHGPRFKYAIEKDKSQSRIIAEIYRYGLLFEFYETDLSDCSNLKSDWVFYAEHELNGIKELKRSKRSYKKYLKKWGIVSEKISRF